MVDDIDKELKLIHCETSKYIKEQKWNKLYEFYQKPWSPPFDLKKSLSTEGAILSFNKYHGMEKKVDIDGITENLEMSFAEN